MSNKLNLKIKQGSTFARSFRWEGLPYKYVPITAISQSAPCAINATAHGLLEMQPFGIQSAKGMTELNQKDFSFPYRATIQGVDDITINSVNSLDYKTHTASTGVIIARTVRDLTGFTARLQIREKVDSDTTLFEATWGTHLTIDTGLQQVKLIIPADETALFTFAFGVYDLELEAPDGTVTPVLQGSVSVLKEVTR